jgi:cysteine desulfurase
MGGYMERIYLDHAATTPVDPRVVEAMEPYFTRYFGNPSSIHAAGREAKGALEAARATIARSIGAEQAEIVFTSGGTESDNAAIAGILAAATVGDAQREIVTSAAEHHAVLGPCKEHGRAGHPISILPVNRDGVVDQESLHAALKQRPLLVSLMYGNNEVGALTPLQTIAGPVHASGALLHSDAVQCLGKVPLDVNTLGVDLMSLTAHKLYGPKGIGALYVRNGTRWNPLLYGGGQEGGRRPGTENVALAVGFAKAVELALARMPDDTARLVVMRDALEVRLKESFPGMLVNSTCAKRLPHILNVSFDSSHTPMQGEMLILNLDLAGIAVSSGSACTSGSVRPSHVLVAMGRGAATAAASVRFSFGRSNTGPDVEKVVVAMKEIVDRMRST